MHGLFSIKASEALDIKASMHSVTIMTRSPVDKRGLDSSYRRRRLDRLFSLSAYILLVVFSFLKIPITKEFIFTNN